jgi:RNA 3'-terminal phosphate cyclase (ATP)
MIEIDGTYGEGGGQILRTSLSLAAITGKPVHLFNIRGKRKVPGLQRQHLTCVNAVAEITGAQCRGNVLNSREVTLIPGAVRAGDYTFHIGGAGGALLVLQTVLPVLCQGDAPSTVTIHGGTHNPWAPPFDFVQESFLPLIARMGYGARAALIRHGFYPAGGGAVRVEIPGAEKRNDPLILNDRGHSLDVSAHILLARLDRGIAEREARAIMERTEIPKHKVRIHEIRDSAGPGNVVMIKASFTGINLCFTAFQERGKKAEIVAGEAADEFNSWFASGAATDGHLADQLLLYVALGGSGGEYTTDRVTDHTRTNIHTLAAFLGCRFTTEEMQGRGFRIAALPVTQSSSGSS